MPCSLQARQNLLTRCDEMRIGVSCVQSRMRRTKTSALDPGSKVLQAGGYVSVEYCIIGSLHH